MRTLNNITPLLLLLLCFTQLYAVDITGYVYDATSHEPLANVNITLPPQGGGTSTGPDGSFSIANLTPGKYVLVTSHIGYKIDKQTLDLSNARVKLEITLEPAILKGQKITVSATRAVDRKTPVAYTDISGEEIDRKYWAQEVPLLLNDVPGVYSYSYTGGGLGYSEVKMRGFDATRVGVTINDVPLNDPLDHITYFYDLPDISANVQDIQVQRGVANSLYGTGALAGSVNIRTESAGSERYIRYTAGTGSYNTSKHTVAFGSGLVNNTYSFYGRFSKVETDGYRDNSGVHSWSYFFSASRYDPHLTTTINLFGGPMRAHFAWEGITREELQSNRKLNYDTYPNAVDDFNQPHYQLINEWTPRKDLKFISTLFHVKGDGYYEQYKDGEDLPDYNMPVIIGNTDTLFSTDLVRQKWVDKSQYGWIPRLQYKWGANDLSLGGEFSFLKSRHRGLVKWAANLPDGIQPDHVYYQHHIDKNSAAVYINDLFQLRPDLFLKLDLQYQHITFKFDQDKIGVFPGYQFDLNYNFLTPRLGLNYNVTPELNVFGNFSMARREPKDGDIYDADSPGALPLFKTLDMANGIYADPYIDAETLYDYEAGLGYVTDVLRFKLNAFWMDFRNEIVPTGGLTDDGYPIYGNAEASVHRGLEADLSGKLPWNTHFNVNGTLSDNYFDKYIEYLWNTDYTGNVQKDRSGNTIGNFPKWMFNAGLSHTCYGVLLSAQYRYVGRMYLDNSQTRALSIDPWSVVNLMAQAKLPNWFGPLQLMAILHVNNVLNEKYELSGYTWDGIGYYIPAAERNFFFTLQTQM